ncbi:MAG: exo-beta-N-acetylmuramidase NamZ domain-containing protein [Sphingomonadales bacterium]
MVKSGTDIVLQQVPVWRKQRIGLVTNDAACTLQGISSRKALLDSGFNLIKIFSPEHGISAAGADGAPMHDQSDPLTRLPVISLYGEKLAPSANDLADLDVLLFDVPDAGTRFYTYLWTLSYCLEVCASVQKPLIVLDRPNPISGLLSLAGGPFLDEARSSSFIGRWSIPIRHSCTLGELALYFNQEKKIGCSLQIICCEGWARHQFYPDTNWKFIPPSPALQQFESLLLYPGTCLLEATNLYEGRGTKQAFSLVAAPWLDTRLLRDRLLACGDLGVNFTEETLRSSGARYAGETCKALLFSVTDFRQFDAVFFGFLLIKCLKDNFSAFAWATYPTAVNPTGQHHLDRLSGVPNSQDWFDLSIDQFKILIRDRCATSKTWSDKINPFLLYK